ncbi:hypothetical protein Cob_v002505 [Colletotrichum orbiculare MAFF 240422]|uniref:Uncharacterized protein n=1 Tax=Colletotrichum orbiculare (strain 104-T / ATCC 96160 / CBS 514.97 / LARS 414 / MAFF 240422) TaxID=1213857 RepID=A0A484G4W1_COLOR|nr:hypothetical protein Cob_v002505 [Colletotrichum orbiculare MAFF 240422]
MIVRRIANEIVLDEEQTPLNRVSLCLERGEAVRPGLGRQVRRSIEELNRIGAGHDVDPELKKRQGLPSFSYSQAVDSNDLRPTSSVTLSRHSLPHIQKTQYPS